MARISFRSNVLYGSETPKFYISPLLTGAEESLGSNAFGTRMEIRLPLDAVTNRNNLFAQVIPRFGLMANFMWGLAYYKNGLYDHAIEQFKKVDLSSSWQQEEGKSILYLWIGAAFNKHAILMRDNNESRINVITDQKCPVGNFINGDDIGCAEASFREALSLDNSFARAYIGLGNIWLDQAKGSIEAGIFIDCTSYDFAIQEYKRALELNSAPTAYVELKTHYNIGLAWVSIYREGCVEALGYTDQSVYDSAMHELKQAIDYSEDNNIPVVLQIRAEAFYQIGIMNQMRELYDEALQAFSSAIYYSEPRARFLGICFTSTCDLISKDFFNTFTRSYYHIGRVYSEMSDKGLDIYWDDAIANYRRVVEYCKGDACNDLSILSDSYYRLGLAYKKVGELSLAVEQFQSGIGVIDEATKSKNQPWQRLRWNIYLDLGEVSYQLSQSEPTPALNAYQKIITAFESSEDSNPGNIVDISLAQDAYYRIGKIYELSSRIEQAKAMYKKAAGMSSGDPRITKEANEHLNKLMTSQ